MFSVRDLFADLPDDWFQEAKSAKNWKPKFQCVQDLYKLCNSLDESDIKSSKRATKVLEILTQWLHTEKHLFTKEKILQILTIIIPRTEPSLWKKLHAKLASATMKQWAEKKIFNLVSPVLTLLWIAQGPLQSWTEALDYAFSSANPVVKSAFWNFLIACATNDANKSKAQLKAVFDDAARFEVLVNDTIQKLADLRLVSTKCLACIILLVKINKANTKLLNAKYEEHVKLKKAVQEEKTAIKALMKKNAEKLKGIPTPTAGGSQTPSFRGGASGSEDEKAEVLSPILPSVDEIYTISEGGLVEPPIDRTSKNAFKAPKIKEGDTLEKSIKDNTSKKIGKPANMKAEVAKEKVSSLCKDVALLDVSEKIGVRVPAVEELYENVSKKQNLTSLAEALIFTIEAYMSWEGKDSRNPMLARLSIEMLEWIFLRSKHLSLSLLPVVLPFLINKMNDRKHGPAVAKVLWALCWQYSPRVVLSRVFALCLELPSERHWTPVLLWVNQVIASFAVHNCNPAHHLYHTQCLLLTAKQEDSKQACYALISNLYQQLGRDWKQACLGHLDGRTREYLEKEMNKCKNLGQVQQTRLVQDEVPPLPQQLQLPQGLQQAQQAQQMRPDPIIPSDGEESNDEAQAPPAASKKKSKSKIKGGNSSSSNKSRGITPKISKTEKVGKNAFAEGPSKKSAGKKKGGKEEKIVIKGGKMSEQVEGLIGALENRVKELELSNAMLVKTVTELQASVQALQTGGVGAGAATTVSDGSSESKEAAGDAGDAGASGPEESNLDMFKDYLENTVKLPAYLEKFKNVDCADITMIEHFDAEFLKETLEIKNPIHIKVLSKYFNQFNVESEAFKKYLVESQEPKLKHYILVFEEKGVITWSLLSKKCQNKNDLKRKFKIENDEHLNALFDLIVKYRNGELELK